MEAHKERRMATVEDGIRNIVMSQCKKTLFRKYYGQECSLVKGNSLLSESEIIAKWTCSLSN